MKYKYILLYSKKIYSYYIYIVENRGFHFRRVDFSFSRHDFNVGKTRYIIFLFQNSKKGHVGYVEDYLHMKGVFLNEKKWFVFDTSRYFTFYIISNLIFDF